VEQHHVGLLIGESEVPPPRRWYWLRDGRAQHGAVDADEGRRCAGEIDVEIIHKRCRGARGIRNRVIICWSRQWQRMPELQAEITLRADQSVDPAVGGD